VKSITVEKRNELRELIHAEGIQTSMHYPPVHLFSSYINESDLLPVTEQYGNQSITLPMYSSLAEEDVDFIVINILKILCKYE
jgi:dTDP-4-amino-4,6-dideoxygalactose transaminase